MLDNQRSLSRIFAEFQGGILVRLVFFLIIVFVLRMLIYVRVKATAITTFPTPRWYAKTSPSTRDISGKNLRGGREREGEGSKREVRTEFTLAILLARRAQNGSKLSKFCACRDRSLSRVS